MKGLYIALVIFFVMTFGWGFRSFLIDKDDPMAKVIVFETIYLERLSRGEYVINFFCDGKNLRQYNVDSGISSLTVASLLDPNYRTLLGTHDSMAYSEDIEELVVAFSGGAAFGITGLDVIKTISSAVGAPLIRKKFLRYALFLGSGLSGYASGAFLSKQISKLDCYDQAQVFDASAADYEKYIFLKLIEINESEVSMNKIFDRVFGSKELTYEWGPCQFAPSSVSPRILDKITHAPDHTLSEVIKGEDFEEVLYFRPFLGREYLNPLLCE